MTLLLSAVSSEPIDTVTHKVFFDIEIDGKAAGRLTFGLFGNTAPRTAENFRAICTGEKGIGESGLPLHYKGSDLFRIIPLFAAHGGDWHKGDASGGESIYGRRFEDENFQIKHTRAGLLTTANAGPNTNSSQFLLLFKESPWLDNRHTVFGELLDNFELLREIERQGTHSTAPRSKVTIVDSGELPLNADL